MPTASSAPEAVEPLDHAETAPPAPAPCPRAVELRPQPGGRIALSWPASTTTNLAGYDVYRSSGGPFAKLNASPISSTSYTDATGAEGTAYTYKVRAISAGAPAFESLDSPTAAATPDATPPILPSAVLLVNGGGQASQYINLANSASVSVSVVLPGTSQATDVVTVTLRSGGQSVSKTAPATAGAGIVTVSGIDATPLPDGTVTIEATVTDAAGNASAPRSTSAPKDTIAPGAPTATYVDRRNRNDRITGTTEPNALVSALQTAPQSSGPYTDSASGTGVYRVDVAETDGSRRNPITVTYEITATDAAGNTSSVTTLTADDSR